MRSQEDSAELLLLFSLLMNCRTSLAHFLGRSMVMAWPHFSTITTCEFLISCPVMVAPDGWQICAGRREGE